MPTTMGIEFAPLDIPMQRRLQTLAAAAVFVVFIFSGPLSYFLLAYIVLFTRFYWLGLAYLAFWYGEGNVAARGSRPSMWVRRWTWWRYFRDYFPINLVKTADIDPSRNYLFCSFPHGLLCSGAFTSFATEAVGVSDVLPGMTTAMITLDQNFNMPFFRELILPMGCCSSSKESLSHLLSHPAGGRVAVLVVGGAAEALDCQPGSYSVNLKKRKGFIKVALRNGAPLVPVFSFGETDLYHQWDNPEGGWLRKAQTLFRKVTGISPIVPLGRGFFQYTFGIIPRRAPVTTVIGKPIEVQKVTEPTEDQINDLHVKFMASLQSLFEEEKHKYLTNAQEISLLIH